MKTRTDAPTGPLALVACPLCDLPVAFDECDDALDCPACAVRLDLACDPIAVALAPAA